MDVSSRVLTWTTAPAVFGLPALSETMNKLQEQIVSIERVAKKLADASTVHDPLVSRARLTVTCGALRVTRIDI